MDLPPPAHVDLTRIIERIARELDATATRCAAVQCSITILLDAVHHPDLAKEIRVLQDIDLVHQTLVDLAAVLTVAAPAVGDAAIARDGIAAALRLESLRRRLADGAKIGDDVQSAAPDQVDITWL